MATNDSPHSLVAAKLSLPLSHHLLTPWLIPYDAWSRYGLGRTAITRYRALDPAAWLKRLDGRAPGPSLRLDPSRPTAVIRMEESYAPYMIGMDRSWGEKLLDTIVPGLRGYNVVILSRYQDQLERISELFADRCTIPSEAVDGVQLLTTTSLFVGMGGTMTTEAALMGVPAISAYQGGLLYTEKYLISKGILKKSRDPNEILGLAARLARPSVRDRIALRARTVLGSMEDPIARIAEYLQTLTDGNLK